MNTSNVERSTPNAIPRACGVLLMGYGRGVGCKGLVVFVGVGRLACGLRQAGGAYA